MWVPKLQKGLVPKTKFDPEIIRFGPFAFLDSENDPVAPSRLTENDSREAQTRNLGGHSPRPRQNSTRRPPEKKERKWEREKEKKNAKFWALQYLGNAPILGPHPFFFERKMNSSHHLVTTLQQAWLTVQGRTASKRATTSDVDGDRNPELDDVPARTEQTPEGWRKRAGNTSGGARTRPRL